MNRRDEARYLGKVEEMFQGMDGKTPEEEPEASLSTQEEMDVFLGAVAYLKQGLKRAGFEEEDNQAQLICTFLETWGSK